MFWWNGFSAVTDLTNPHGRSWFTGQLDHLVREYGVDGFKLDGGDAARDGVERSRARFGDWLQRWIPGAVLIYLGMRLLWQEN